MGRFRRWRRRRGCGCLRRRRRRDATLKASRRRRGLTHLARVVDHAAQPRRHGAGGDGSLVLIEGVHGHTDPAAWRVAEQRESFIDLVAFGRRLYLRHRRHRRHRIHQHSRLHLLHLDHRGHLLRRRLGRLLGLWLCGLWLLGRRCGRGRRCRRWHRLVNRHRCRRRRLLNLNSTHFWWLLEPEARHQPRVEAFVYLR